MYMSSLIPFKGKSIGTRKVNMIRDNEIKVTRINNEEDFKDAQKVRKTVFVLEQNVPADNEFDQFEDESVHVLVRWKENPIATGRIRPVEDVMKCERICVLKEARKMGVGKMVVDELEKIALEKGAKKLILHAQTHAIPFYEKLGYIITSDSLFYEEGIPHVSMEKEL